MSLGRKKHYFLPPVPEVPVDGPIRLGNIVADPKCVFEPINNSPVNPSWCLEKVYVSNSGPASIVLGESSKKNIGIFAELPAFVNANISGDSSADAKERWSFENLRTIWFTAVCRLRATRFGRYGCSALHPDQPELVGSHQALHGYWRQSRVRGVSAVRICCVLRIQRHRWP